jgi:hypothetical protein
LRLLTAVTGVGLFLVVIAGTPCVSVRRFAMGDMSSDAHTRTLNSPLGTAFF